ncbi:MAG TPA: enoyl-CoA hydratase/isomerase family protein [Acidimicrobiales bacterium]|nr:enoyl-CoA hydratase/isomerase family protein [Acidimicrobiales bacterium]
MPNPFEPEILIEERGPIRIVTLNRPEARNAANQALHRKVSRVWRYLDDDPEVRAVVLTGAGKAFCAGGDMELFRALHSDHVTRRRIIDEAGRVAREMVAFSLPIVAAVNGAAVGLGANLAVLSDLVLMAESSYLQDPHVEVGLTAADGGAPIWPLYMSILRVKEYLFTGARIPADKAVELGLATRVVPDDKLFDEALELATRLAEQPPQALQTTKRAVNMHLARAMDGIVDYALAAEFQSFDTPEHQAVVERFLGR